MRKPPQLAQPRRLPSSYPASDWRRARDTVLSTLTLSQTFLPWSSPMRLCWQGNTSWPQEHIPRTGCTRTIKVNGAGPMKRQTPKQSRLAAKATWSDRTASEA